MKEQEQWAKRQACRIMNDLPLDREEAERVLGYVKELFEFVYSNENGNPEPKKLSLV